MPALKYIGKTIAEVGVVPLPEGWPAADHDEPDEALAAEKLAHNDGGSYELADGHGGRLNDLAEGVAAEDATDETTETPRRGRAAKKE